MVKKGRQGDGGWLACVWIFRSSFLGPKWVFSSDNGSLAAVVVPAMLAIACGKAIKLDAWLAEAIY